jgi:hypothetical protein
MKIDLGQINPGAVVKISIEYTFEPAKVTIQKYAKIGFGLLTVKTLKLH